MRTRSSRAVLILALVAARATGCGDDSDRERATAALQAEILADAAMRSDQPVDTTQTRCVAEGMVDDLGLERLQRYQLLTEDLRADESLEGVELTPADADVLAEVFAGCMDVEALMERQIVAGLDLAPRRQRRAEGCVEEKVTTEEVVGTMSLEFQGVENSAFDRLRTELARCLRGGR